MGQNTITLETVSMVMFASPVSSNHCCGVANQSDGRCHEVMSVILIWPIKFIFSR